MTDVLGGSQHSSGILRGTRPQPHTPTLSARRREPLPPLWLSPEERLCRNNQPVYAGAGLPELPTRPPQRWGSARNRLTPHGHAAAARSPERFGPRKEIPPLSTRQSARRGSGNATAPRSHRRKPQVLSLRPASPHLRQSCRGHAAPRNLARGTGEDRSPGWQGQPRHGEVQDLLRPTLAPFTPLGSN